MSLEVVLVKTKHFSSCRSHPRSVTQPQRPMSASPHHVIPSPPSTKRQRPSSARPRPSSAKLTHSSYKDYLVRSASQEIVQSAAATRKTLLAGDTKTSLLRLNMRRKSSSWVLPETREYLAKAPQDYKASRRNPKGRNEETM